LTSKLGKRFEPKNSVTWDKVHLPNHPHELPFVGGEELHAGQELWHIKKQVSQLCDKH